MSSSNHSSENEWGQQPLPLPPPTAATPAVVLHPVSAEKERSSGLGVVLTLLVVFALVLSSFLFSDRIKAAVGGEKCPILDFASDALKPLQSSGPIEITEKLAFIPKIVDSYARDCEPLSWAVVHGTTVDKDSLLSSTTVKAEDQTPAAIALPFFHGEYTEGLDSPVFPGDIASQSPKSGGELELSWDNGEQSARFDLVPDPTDPPTAADISAEFSSEDGRNLPRITPIAPEELGGTWPDRSWVIEDVGSPGQETPESTTQREANKEKKLEIRDFPFEESGFLQYLKPAPSGIRLHVPSLVAKTYLDLDVLIPDSSRNVLAGITGSADVMLFLEDPPEVDTDGFDSTKPLSWSILQGIAGQRKGNTFRGDETREFGSKILLLFNYGKFVGAYNPEPLPGSRNGLSMDVTRLGDDSIAITYKYQKVGEYLAQSLPNGSQRVTLRGDGDDIRVVDLRKSSSSSDDETTTPTSSKKKSKRTTTRSTSSAAASKGKCSIERVQADTGFNPPGKANIIYCDETWARYGQHQTDWIEHAYWNGSKWIQLKPDGEISTPMTVGCYSDSTLASLPPRPPQIELYPCSRAETWTLE